MGFLGHGDELNKCECGQLKWNAHELCLNCKKGTIKMDYIKYFHIEKPTQGKFVAFYSDGSGANMFLVVDGGYLSTEGEDYYDENFDSFSTWIQLPDDFGFWFEYQ